MRLFKSYISTVRTQQRAVLGKIGLECRGGAQNHTFPSCVKLCDSHLDRRLGMNTKYFLRHAAVWHATISSNTLDGVNGVKYKKEQYLSIACL